MSRHNQVQRQRTAAGYTLVELLVVMSVAVILFISFGTFFTNYLTLYFGYQRDANNFSELSQQSQRVSNVMRGIVDISSLSANDLVAYAYFAPTDTYTSVTHYYLNAAKTAVIVEVTPMTANPPVGTPIAASKKTYTIITNYYQPAGGSLFTYYDSGGTALTLPVANEHVVNQIGVNLAEPTSTSGKPQQFNVTVSLRNRKTNL